MLTKVQASMHQSQLKVFQGQRLPFTSDQAGIVQEQFLHATVSANLPFRWIEDPEVITLFLLFWSTAGDVIPSRQQISGLLLDKANEAVHKQVKRALQGKYAVLTSDGWKDDSQNAISGVNLSVEGKTYLIDLINSTAHKKDGAAMCEAFEGMIDRAEQDYGVYIVALCCDNDGGSQDYFIENEEAAQTAEEATCLIGWVLNHGRVCSLFDETQEELTPGKVLAFLVVNITRWNTHYIAFDRLLTLKDAMHQAVIL
ncbi:hypothetical protein C0995_000316 [Termitomyces sp. Mi166|nr:hypothetical protein C0995_000316 [Termitomyces sp. Mi166\